jgi:hypothetical protein
VTSVPVFFHEDGTNRLPAPRRETAARLPRETLAMPIAADGPRIAQAGRDGNERASESSSRPVARLTL